jgi:REP element-mobilizing transposase RayT
VEVAGGVHHVFARGNGKRTIFLVEHDRRLYLRLVGQVLARQQWNCLAYCLMDNHVHLLLETPQPNLGAGMCRLQGLYAQTFNKRHGRCGHLFGERFGSVLMRSDEQLLTVARYIALNPVEAGLIEDAADWPWSSHAAVVNGVAAPAWLDVARLLAYFGASGGDPRKRYAEVVR